ncbi:hypothetical protein DM860_014800 [Cuscuta australis]|uniref:Uncharacterized protein n=1 Tax=Cuscuta australis TaxID=267555 RepID=A0A328D0F7_9ASTE|nr:hypothetical protein DM860_014800 [Cuscuta australis]
MRHTYYGARIKLKKGQIEKHPIFFSKTAKVQQRAEVAENRGSDYRDHLELNQCGSNSKIQ